MNTTTAITLNDRFSMLKKAQSQSRLIRGRSRSRSRSRGPSNQAGGDLRGSRRNRILLSQLERQHKMRIAMKLKNRSILTTRGRAQGQIVRQNTRRAATIKKTMNVRNLRRANNLTTFVPLKDSPSGRMNRGRSRSRSRSRNRIQNTGTIQDRLGIRNQPNGRRRMRRGPPVNSNGAVQRSRSRSRVRLNRNNFRNSNAVPLKRSNSVNARLGRNGPSNTVQQKQTVRRRFRSQRRINNNNNNTTRFNRPLTGRIVKRKNTTGGLTKQIRRPNSAGSAIRNAKKFKRAQVVGIGNRGNQGVARGRARSRGGKFNNNNNQRGRQQQKQQQQTRRGRSRTRRGGGTNGRQQISKEQLDKQLDDYMAKGSA